MTNFNAISGAVAIVVVDSASAVDRRFVEGRDF
jgi:hypothetical protein